MPRHIAAITRVGEVLGFTPDTFTDVELVSVDRVFDEVYQQGYEAGSADSQPVTFSVTATGVRPGIASAWDYIGTGYGRVDL